jgi:branched-chain amino acid transport system substrate-binding protein
MNLFKIPFQGWLIFLILAAGISYISATKSHSGPDQLFKIGLLTAENKSISARQGAEIAILEANKKENLKGHRFELVTKSLEGPWGAGSKEAVRMVFEENVWAIMGSHDGRNAHLVEQVSAKTHVIFLSSWSSDPTLSKAFVPWYFSCVPNDIQQADALIEEIYVKRKMIKVGAAADDSYDSKMAMNSFVKETIAARKTSPAEFIYNNTESDFSDLLDKIDRADLNCIVLFGKPSVSMKIFNQLLQRNLKLKVFGSLSMLGEEEPGQQGMKINESIVLVSSGYWMRPKGLTFREEYHKKFGSFPDEEAAYAYDGMNVLIEAVINSGFDREMIQKSMAKTHYEGVTGSVRFDDKGNRFGSAGLIEIKNDFPPGRD